jgi:hypothetical protein
MCCLQLVPQSERRALFEEYCRESAASKKAGASKAVQRPAAAATAPAAVPRPSSAGVQAPPLAGVPAHNDDSGPTARAAFEQLLSDVEGAARDGIATAAPIAASGGGEGGREEGEVVGEALAMEWDETLTLEKVERVWGGDSRWRGCSASVRREVFEARLRPVMDAARRRKEEEFRCAGRRDGCMRMCVCRSGAQGAG